MLRLPPFRYKSPSTPAEAVSMAADWPEAMLVAGGTDLFPKMKRRQFSPKVLIGLRDLTELRRFNGDPRNGMRIGAGVSLTTLHEESIIRQGYAALAEAAEQISTPQLRNMGTIGGNLCVDTRCTYYDQTYEWRRAIHFCLKKDGDTCWVAPGAKRCWAVSSCDSGPALMALGATIRLLSPRGQREMPVDELYQDDGMDYLTKAAGELILDIHLPPQDGWRSTYVKLRRRGAFDFPVLGVGAALKVAKRKGKNGMSVVEDVRLAVGGVAPAPMRFAQAENILKGQEAKQDRIEEAAEAVYRPVKAMDNTDLVPYYRKKMARVFVKRALTTLLALW